MPKSTATTPLKLNAFLPYRLSVLSNTISRNIAELYDREFGLSIGQWRVMAVIGETAGLSATEIGAVTAMDKVAVSRAVAGLIELGYLEREPSPEDARRSSLTLTRIGRQIYNEIVPMALGEEKRLAAALTSEELKSLEALMNKLAAAAEPTRKLW